MGDFVHTLGDAHLYWNQMEQADKQLLRGPRALPRLSPNLEATSIFDFRFDDIAIVD